MHAVGTMSRCCAYLQVGLVGFCYGGGKALAYSTKYKEAKATVVIYGKPVSIHAQDAFARRSLERRDVISCERIWQKSVVKLWLSYSINLVVLDPVKTSIHPIAMLHMQILDSDLLKNIYGCVLGIFGDQDSQFPASMVRNAFLFFLFFEMQEWLNLLFSKLGSLLKQAS